MSYTLHPNSWQSRYITLLIAIVLAVIKLIALNRFMSVNVRCVHTGIIWRILMQVLDPAEDYVKLLKTIFDFEAIKKLLHRNDFSFVYDAMHGGVCSTFT